MRQMALDLFPTAKHDPWEGFLEWARDSKGWMPEHEHLARQVLDSCHRDWWDRCKEIVSHCGYAGRDPSELLAAGILDPQLHYHTVWDRAWAIRNGVPVAIVGKVAYWDYGKKLPACRAARMEVLL